MTEPLRLVDRHPSLTAEDLVTSLVPPRRFATVRLDTYVPNPEHPTQADACTGIARFVGDLDTDGGGGSDGPVSGGRRFPRWRPVARSGDVVDTGGGDRRGRYLDGGFGVGKTHLLAAAWHQAEGAGVSGAYLTFAELTAVIGFLGMTAAASAFQRFRLICLDEFELDDVANTLMAVTFLRATVAEGDARVIATSNSLPDRLGEGRFAAADFRREIEVIADHFEVARIDGPDYRARTRTSADACTPAEARRFESRARDQGLSVSTDEAMALLEHLRVVHPVQYHAMVEGLDAVVLTGLRPLGNQGDALLFVHLIDELYDAEVPVVLEGCAIDELFPETYRQGGYRKKYGRCESRLAALCAEAHRQTGGA